MNSSKKLLMVLAVLGMLCYPAYVVLTFESALQCNTYLESAGIRVVEGDISSPSLILDVDYPVLLLIAEATSGTVYRDGFVFYVFDSTMLTAYRYQPKIGYRYDWVRTGD